MERRTPPNCRDARLALQRRLGRGRRPASAKDISAKEWKIITDRCLLDDLHERPVVSEYKRKGGFVSLLLVSWALAEVEKALPKELTDDRTASLIAAFREQAYAFRGHCGRIVNELEHPVPFPYYHALDVFILINLVVVS
jgi:hypothetical protein